MRIPGFTAERSADSARGHYIGRAYTASAKPSAVRPQQGRCFCAEPDTRTVCRGGRCREIEVCLQWYCLEGGAQYDAEFGAGEGVGPGTKVVEVPTTGLSRRN
jgi:hypothetical protein